MNKTELELENELLKFKVTSLKLKLEEAVKLMYFINKKWFDVSFVILLLWATFTTMIILIS